MRVTCDVLRKAELAEQVTILEVGSLADAYRLEQEIKDLKERIKEKEKFLESILDRYSESRVFEEGRYVLEEHTSKSRELNQAQFKTLYEDVLSGNY